jgi:hypothetical protein
MAQQRAESPEVIYDALTADTAFMALVGEVTFTAGNTTLDAISIVTPNEPLPSIESITGLEVVIHDITNKGRRLYVGHEVDITTTHNVYLLAWPGANGSTLSDAADRMMEIFSKATTIQTSRVPNALGAVAQVLVTIPSDSVITSA